jgi:hypothetical protein
MFPSTLQILEKCTAICERVGGNLLSSQDIYMRGNQLKLMKDCADICNTCAMYMARNSPYTQSLANYCAYVCEACANECLRFSDHDSQLCGQTCLECARACRTFAMAS